MTTGTAPTAQAEAAEAAGPPREHERGAWEDGAVGHRVSCPEFVGRDRELGMLGVALDAAAGGRAATVLVGGDAGIGKTRLVDELGIRAAEAGALVATGVCVPIDGGGLPYGPVVGILRDIARQLGAAAAADALGALAPGLELEPPGAAAAARTYSLVTRVADEMAKTRSFEAILACLTGLADRSPLVLVLEDLHWADSASAELVGFLTRNLTDARVLLVGTYRADELGPGHRLHTWLGELGRHARVVGLHLDGLDRDETTALIAGILGRPPDWALADGVWTRSQGNPFFAEELTAARHRTSLSPELTGLLANRVEGLSDEAGRLLRVVATAGGAASHRLLAHLGVVDADALDGALAEAVGRQVLVVDESRSGYRFRHALFREVVDGALLPGEKSRLHRLIAVALHDDASLWPEPAVPTGTAAGTAGVPGRATGTAGTSSSPAGAAGVNGLGHRAAELAAHWWAAGEWSEALDASVTAAGAATAVWAFPEAHAHLERALAALDRVPAGNGRPPPHDRLGLLEAASDAAYLAGADQRSVDLAREAIAGTDADAEPGRAARYLALLGRNALAIGDSDVAFDAYRRAAALVAAAPPSVSSARVLAEEARGLMLMSRFREAEQRSHRALTVAAEVGARAEEGHVLYTLGCCRASLGHHDEGIELVRRALAMAEELASPDDLNRAYMGLSSLLVEAGRLEQAVAVVFDAAAAGDELWGFRMNGAAGNGVDALVRLGRHDEAEALLARAGERGVGTCTAAPPLLRATMAIRCGRLDEADRCLATADELTARLADVQTRAVFHMHAAELALTRHRPEDALAEVERALALAAPTDDETFLPEMAALAVRCLADAHDGARARGRPFDVEAARERALGFVREADRIVAAAGGRGGQAPPRSRAWAATAAAEHSRLAEPDPDLWAGAAVCWDDAREPHPAAHCRWREAEALLASSGVGVGRARAHDCLQHAWRASAELGARPLSEAIEGLARRARIPLRPADPGVHGDDGQQDEAARIAGLADDLGLTRREVEVLGELAAGRTDREIGELLYISRKTASVHVSNLLRKLNVANRVEAGGIGQAHGLG